MSDAQFAAINGSRIRFQMVGSGPPLVIQPPGWGIGVGLYEQTLDRLAEFCTVITYDTRGSGGSTRDVDPATINVGQFIEDLEGLRVHLGLDRFALLGHSHGGYIVLNFAIHYPDRLNNLIPVDAQVGVDEPGEDLQRTLPERAQHPEYAEAVAAFTADWDTSSDAGVGEFLQRVLPLYFHDVSKAGPVIAGVAEAPPAVAAFLATNASDDQFPVRDRLREIRVPTLVIVGRHDFICSPVQAAILQQGIHDAHMQVFEQSGHFPWIEEPEAFVAAVRTFLIGQSS